MTHTHTGEGHARTIPNCMAVTMLKNKLLSHTRTLLSTVHPFLWSAPLSSTFFFFKFKLNRMGQKSWMMSVLAVAFQCSPSLGGGCEGPEPTFPPEVARTTQADAFTPTATGCSPVCWIPISIPDPRQSLRCLALPAKPKSRGSFQCLPTERPRLHFPPEAPSGGRFEAKSQNVSVE